MFRSATKRFLSTSGKVTYDNHGITVCSMILYTSVLSFAHRKETTEQNERILKEIQLLKNNKNDKNE
jgi:hypothetical protein